MSEQLGSEQSDSRVPDRNLPHGVGPAWFDPQTLRLAAEASNRGAIHASIEVKPWVLLTLLDAYEEGRRS